MSGHPLTYTKAAAAFTPGQDVARQHVAVNICVDGNASIRPSDISTYAGSIAWEREISTPPISSIRSTTASLPFTDLPTLFLTIKHWNLLPSIG